MGDIFRCFWVIDSKGVGSPPRPAATEDQHVAFRAAFRLATALPVEVRLLAAADFLIYLDGRWIGDGPARFSLQQPEFVSFTAEATAGEHTLALHAHYHGVALKRLPLMPPFVACRLLTDEGEIPLCWQAETLAGYRPRTRRINADLGWAEWCDTRRCAPDWEAPAAVLTPWVEAVPAAPGTFEAAPARLAPVRQEVHRLAPVADGLLAETYGYELDDPPLRFFLRDIECRALPPQGLWRRYDLGRVRLGRPRFVLAAPPGAVVEFGMAEALRSGRVGPWIPLSGLASCNLDHYVARGGPQEFMPVTAKGGRFLELHVLAPPQTVRFLAEDFVERCYHGEPVGAFRCRDRVLNAVWRAGVETHRACSEDALTDNPTRERGQWTGDAVAGLDTAAVAFGDLRLCRRALVQAAQSAHTDGFVACLSPSEGRVIPSFAALWVGACARYYECTGEREFLRELYESARRNLAAFKAHWTAEGLAGIPHWNFLDWGYAPASGPTDLALDLLYLRALQAMSRWDAWLGRADGSWAAEARAVAASLRARLEVALSAGGFPGLGYHVAALSLASGLLDPDAAVLAVSAVKEHILRCFPNRTEAPRLSDPGVSERQLITPYFANFVFPPLIEHGEVDFVLNQYRKCWGWALAEGCTTCLEVFDTRWSHCHQWSGCPAWQLSTYVLGLRRRFDLGRNHFDLRLRAGSLRAAEGRVPLDSGHVSVKWSRRGERIRYELQPTDPVWLARGGEPALAVSGKQVLVL